MVSSAVAGAYRARGVALPANVTLVPTAGQRGVVVLLSEYPESVRNERWGPVDPGQLQWFGTREVNLSVYPTWRPVSDKAVLLTNAQAARFGVCPPCADAPR
jgi:hypothetical protein